MAFEDYDYEADQYENYAMDMANGNYDKSHSEFIKEIKCNNINSNINGNDNTINVGSRLGLGDESLQDNALANTYGHDKLSNDNFDLECINNNEGGVPGPQGPNQILSSSIYTAEGDTDSTIGKNFASSTAKCDLGDTVLSGSYVFTIGTSTPTPTDISRLQDYALLTEDGWIAEVVVENNEIGSIKAIAQCFDNPPAHMSLATASVAEFQQPEDSPITSQGIENSPKLTALEKQQPTDSPQLTATEKITKLKTQWMELTS
jgi:hypothetical protein